MLSQTSHYPLWNSKQSWFSFQNNTSLVVVNGSNKGVSAVAWLQVEAREKREVQALDICQFLRMSPWPYSPILGLELNIRHWEGEGIEYIVRSELEATPAAPWTATQSQ